jgi:uncharacterized membrane protein YgcG
MTTAYNPTWLENLDVIKTARDWKSNNFISPGQYDGIVAAYPSGFFHPNFLIRILLLIASVIALAGVTGLLFLGIQNASGDTMIFASIVYGLASFLILETVLIKGMNHYKSGVTEALLYHSAGFTIGGFIGLFEGETYSSGAFCLIVFLWSAIRYADLISTAGGMFSVAFLLFMFFYDLGGIARDLIPVGFIVVFTASYFFVRKIRRSGKYFLWENCLIVAEALCLLFIYAAGNYFVVRELSISMLDMYLEAGDEIPFAFLFYSLTVIIPAVYLYFAIKKRDLLLLRVSLLALAFSVFTFKYYYSTGHHEITLTVSGIFLIGIALALFRYLRTPRNGYTHENLMKEKWADANPEAFVISQTMGGNTVTVETGYKGGGGTFGGGGGSGTF